MLMMEAIGVVIAGIRSGSINLASVKATLGLEER
jgi:hypothetical protein